MDKVILLNKDGKRFEKEFTSPYRRDLFVNKAKRGNKVKVLGIIKGIY